MKWMDISIYPLPVRNASLPAAPLSEGAFGPWDLSEQDPRDHRAVAGDQEHGMPAASPSLLPGL